MSNVRIGILGCGRIGKMHADLIARRTPGATVSMVFDAFPDAAAAVAAELGVPVAASAKKLITSAKVDAVAICTSTDTHAELLIMAAKAGKAIFCEKPISLDLATVDAALAEVTAAGVPLQIGFNRRFDPAHASVQAAVASGSLGDVYITKITSRDPAPPPLAYVKVSGGLFLDMMIHDFDMARFVVGSEVVEVYAQAAVRITPKIATAFGPKKGDVDVAIVTLRHANGALTVIDNSRQAVYGYDQRVEVLGSKGMAASENPLAHTGIRRDATGSTSELLPFFFLDRYIPSYVNEWAAFVDMVANGKPSPVNAADGRAPLVIGLAALKSLAERRPVQISEIG
jgi:myo-inositol 2-dehydrogenase / D-chiro-inositol 1-dehydrogenase